MYPPSCRCTTVHVGGYFRLLCREPEQLAWFPYPDLDTATPIAVAETAHLPARGAKRSGPHCILRGAVCHLPAAPTHAGCCGNSCPGVSAVLDVCLWIWTFVARDCMDSSLICQAQRSWLLSFRAPTTGPCLSRAGPAVCLRQGHCALRSGSGHLDVGSVAGGRPAVQPHHAAGGRRCRGHGGTPATSAGALHDAACHNCLWSFGLPC